VNHLEPHLYYGLDLGRRESRSALAVIERVHQPTGARDAASYEPVLRLRFVVRHLEAFRPGLPYLRVVRRLERLLNEPRRLGAYELRPGHALRPRQTLVVDASGVGAPVVEAFQAIRLEASLRPITITGAGRPGADAFGTTQVARRDLLSNLRLLMERGLLRLPRRLHERLDLVDECLRATARSGPAHDDRLMALALAAWQATRGLAAWIESESRDGRC
jgi:hypothetical protein